MDPNHTVDLADLFLRPPSLADLGSGPFGPLHSPLSVSPMSAPASPLMQEDDVELLGDLGNLGLTGSGQPSPLPSPLLRSDGFLLGTSSSLPHSWSAEELSLAPSAASLGEPVTRSLAPPGAGPAPVPAAPGVPASDLSMPMPMALPLPALTATLLLPLAATPVPPSPSALGPGLGTGQLPAAEAAAGISPAGKQRKIPSTRKARVESSSLSVPHSPSSLGSYRSASGRSSRAASPAGSPSISPSPSAPGTPRSRSSSRSSSSSSLSLPSGTGPLRRHVSGPVPASAHTSVPVLAMPVGKPVFVGFGANDPGSQAAARQRSYSLSDVRGGWAVDYSPDSSSPQPGGRLGRGSPVTVFVAQAQAHVQTHASSSSASSAGRVRRTSSGVILSSSTLALPGDAMAARVGARLSQSRTLDGPPRGMHGGGAGGGGMGRFLSRSAHSSPISSPSPSHAPALLWPQPQHQHPMTRSFPSSDSLTVPGAGDLQVTPLPPPRALSAWEVQGPPGLPRQSSTVVSIPLPAPPSP